METHDKDRFEAECLEALNALSRTMVQLGLYDPSHPSVAETLQGGSEAIARAIEENSEGELVFSKDEDKWLANGRVIGLVSQAGGPVLNLIRRLKLASITFLKGLTIQELIAFCELSAIRADLEVNLEAFLSEHGVTHVRFNEAVYAQVSAEEKLAVKEAKDDAPAPEGKTVDDIRAAVEGQPIETALQILIRKVAGDPTERAKLFDLIITQLRREMAHMVVQATEILHSEKSQVEFERERTQSVLQNVGAGIIIVDEAGKIILMNPAAEEIYGAPLSEVAGKLITSKADEKRVVAMAAELQAPADRPLNKDIQVQGSDDTKRTIQSSWAIVKNEAGRVVGVVLSLTDLAKHRELEKVKREFVAHITHELRAPIFAIQAALELLKLQFQGKLNEKQEGTIAGSLRNVQLLTRLVNDILDFSKIESGQMTVYRRPADPAKIAGEAGESLRPWAQARKLSLSVAMEPGLPPVWADPQRTIQVLINLLSNAIKFTPAEGAIVLSVFRSKTEPDRFVEFAVADNGCGIPVADQQRIFEKFVQIGNKEMRAGGTGLGLAIVKALVDLHGGQIWVESAEGRGSIFHFTVPIHKAETEAAPAAKRPWWKVLLGIGS